MEGEEIDKLDADHRETQKYPQTNKVSEKITN